MVREKAHGGQLEKYVLLNWALFKFGRNEGARGQKWAEVVKRALEEETLRGWTWKDAKDG